MEGTTTRLPPPREIIKEQYYEIKTNQKNLPPELVGFVGFLCSFGGKWWGGYAANNKGDNYAERGSRCLLKQIENLKDVVFTNLDYREIPIPPNSIIYCDPPYRNTTQYSSKFNHDEFYQWCLNMNQSGHKVYISEYNMPDEFECILKIEHKTILDKNSQYPRVEKLFKPK